MSAALVVEMRKARAAWTVRGSILALAAGTTALSLAFALAVRTGDAQVLAKLGAAGSAPGWPGAIASAAQVAGAGSLLAVGVVAAWVTGREFADGTVGGLFAVAVGRDRTAAAKLVVVLLAAGASAVLTVLGVVVVGLVLGYGIPGTSDLLALGRLLVLVALAGPLALPCAWASTAGRGLLPGIGVAVGLLAVTQVLVVAGTGAWLPTAVPVLWTLDPSAVAPAALLGPLVLGAVAALITRITWRTLELDR